MCDDVQIDDLANVIFSPLPAHAMTFTSPSSEKQTLMKERSATELVSLPFIDLPSLNICNQDMPQKAIYAVAVS